MKELKGRKRQAAALLRKAAKVLEEFGWTQSRLGDEASGFCSLGAIYKAAGCESQWLWTRRRWGETQLGKDQALAQRALSVVLSGKNDGIVRVASINDGYFFTKKKAIAGLRKAAAALEHGLYVV